MLENKYIPPFRVGRKQKRAVLDSTGVQLALFETGSEEIALKFCEFLNKEVYGTTNIY